MKRLIQQLPSKMVFYFLAMAISHVFANEILDLDVISYEAFMQEDKEALHSLQKALYEKGIVGIRGIPTYKEKVSAFIEKARAFAALDENTKETYAPNRERGDLFLGYESGKEQFQRPDGRWVIDDLKASYYAFIPDTPENRWPIEVELSGAFESLGMLMSEIGEQVMHKMGILGDVTGISIEGVPKVGRMLHYKKGRESEHNDPFWCGAHYDHGLFTALVPAYYFQDQEPIEEPMEAGLFVKTHLDGQFKKIVASDLDVMLFQVGEFGQLITDDRIRATEHRVQKAQGEIERLTLAVFFPAPLDLVIYSQSELAQDARYGGKKGDPCSFQDWRERTFQRFLVTEKEGK